MDLSTLKGEKKIQAILSLGTDSENAELLLSLTESEKGNSKQAAMQALANFDYMPAIHVWRKLLKSKSKGEKVFVTSSVDSISDIIADDFSAFLSSLFDKPDGYSLTECELTDFKTFISIMLGKGSRKMQDLYSLIAENSVKLSTFIFEPTSKGLLINDYIHFYHPTPEDIKKIFPAVLSMSILKSMDNRLINLAENLNTTYGENWISPVFISELLTQPSHSVFDRFSSFLTGSSAKYLCDTLGALYFDNKLEKHIGLLFWGQCKYGEIDARFSFSCPLFENLDERWFSLLAVNHQDEVTLQAYNRGGVLYESYDEMFVEIIPRTINDKNIEQELQEYFIKKEAQHNGSSTLYLAALNILNCEIKEDAIERFIQCKDNAVSKYSLRVDINQYTNWTNQRKLDFYKKLPKHLIVEEEIESLKNATFNENVVERNRLKS